MKSVRLTPELEARLERAAKASSTSQSEFIRRAVERQCDEVLGCTLAERLKDVIGIIDGGGGRANRTGEAMRRILRERKRK
jgi:predicted DNA-binding protein